MPSRTEPYWNKVLSMKETTPNNNPQDLLLTEDQPDHSDTIISSVLPEDGNEEVLFRAEETTSSAPAHPSLDEQQYLETYQQKDMPDSVHVPLLGTKPVATHRRTLSILVVLFLLIPIGLNLYSLQTLDDSHKQAALTATGALQLNAARLSRNTHAAMAGSESAFAEVKTNYQNISNSMAQLGNADRNSVALIEQNLGSSLAPEVETVVAQQKTLQPLLAAARDTSSDARAVQEQVDVLKNTLAQRNAPASQTLAVGDIGMLVERLEKSAQQLLTAPSATQEVSQQLGKDLTTIDALLKTLSTGDNTLGVVPLQPGEQILLEKIGQAYAPLKTKIAPLAAHEQDLLVLRQAHDRITTGVESAMPNIMALSQLLGTPQTVNPVIRWGIYAGTIVCGLLALLAVYGIVYISRADARRMQMMQRLSEAENSRNQSAILLLMDELQNIAEGDLTRDATVTEEITGAIADSVNNTIEEWRGLIGNAQNMVDKVVQTTADVELTSAVLQEASNEQLLSIRHAGQSVLEMAKRINSASYQAKDSALVALRARQAAVDGHKAVQDSMHGMNLIRDQIQDTAKRIKRLGESSQEIGEITELISDITEQTNVLALNAAIQAASAGDAGRGFSVVAEEVQRLAERSAEATRQISVLVKTIQSDTHDAIAAMERSTQEVVHGAQLSDNAGKALEEIDRVSNNLSDLIQQISATTSEEANQAGLVANNIQEIFSVTEQATEGTRTTDQTVRELAKVARELRASITRFKIK